MEDNLLNICPHAALANAADRIANTRHWQLQLIIEIIADSIPLMDLKRPKVPPPGNVERSKTKEAPEITEELKTLRSG